LPPGGLAEESADHFPIRQISVETPNVVITESEDGGEMLIEDPAVLRRRVVKDHCDAAEAKNRPDDLNFCFGDRMLLQCP
jgi:hypothetical protein